MHRSFGLSTHLFHDQRLARGHLEAIAAHGFAGIELFATRTHFDYHDPAAAEQLARWLEDTRLPAAIIMQVHDELVLEVDLAPLDEVKAGVTLRMAAAAALAVPLVVEAGSGANWDEAH